MVTRSITVKFCTEILPLSTRHPRPFASGLLSLTAATSKAGSASAAIGLGGDGGFGIDHSLSAVTRVRVHVVGTEKPLSVPVMELPSALTFAADSAPIPGMLTFTPAACKVRVAGKTMYV